MTKSICLDLFDNVYDLIDVLTFKTHAIAPAMWPVFELTYKLFKSDAIDFLDGEPSRLRSVSARAYLTVQLQRCYRH